MRFLLSRRWLTFFVVVLLLAWGAWALGQWQFHRLKEKRAANELIVANLSHPIVPLNDLLAVGRQPTAEQEWRRVSVTGRWDVRHTIVVKYQVRHGTSGVDLVTPLVRGAHGPAVLVDRGWMPTANTGDTRPALPPLRPGPVTVTGYVRVNGSGGATNVDQLSTRAISSLAVAPVLSYRLYGGFIDLAEQSPAPLHALGIVQMPDDTGDGPHFFYGLQWWFFGALALFGFGFLAYDEHRRAQESQPGAAAVPPRPAGAPESGSAGDGLGTPAGVTGPE